MHGEPDSHLPLLGPPWGKRRRQGGGTLPLGDGSYPLAGGGALGARAVVVACNGAGTSFRWSRRRRSRRRAVEASSFGARDVHNSGSVVRHGDDSGGNSSVCQENSDALSPH